MPSKREKALVAFQRLRRFQCADSNGFATCISCGKVYPVTKMDGGHYEGRKNRATELEPDNVWAQCKYCNGPLSGNPIAYRNRLLNLIGFERLQRVEDLALAAKGSDESMARLNEDDRQLVTTKRKDKEYERLTKEYNSIAKILGKEKNINVA